MSESRPPLIQLRDVEKTYHTGKVPFHALKGVNLTVAHGEYMAIFGPSGSGKSTLMHILGCLATPSSGQYQLDGREVSHFTRNQLAHVRNRKIGFIFQSFNLLPHLSALDNVMLPLTYRGTSYGERRKRAANLLAALGLKTHVLHRPPELSGGQQQRVAIARALVTEPSILLADEPTGNLDSRSGQEVIQLFDEFATQGRTIIVVTHDAAVAEHTQRIVRLHDGRIADSQEAPPSHTE